MMRVAYLVSLFPCWSETFILREIQTLSARGVDVRILSLRPPAEPLVQDGARPMLASVLYPRPWRRVVAALARRLIRTPGTLLGVFAGAAVEARALGAREVPKAFYTIAAAAYFAERLDDLAVDHVHAHWATYPALAGRTVRRLTGRPYTLTAHAHDIFLPNPYLDGNLAAASTTVTISEYNRRYLADRGVPIERISVVPCGLDLEALTPPAGTARTPGSIVAVGRLEPIKGFPDLVSACALLRDHGVKFTCDVVGDGSLRQALEREIEARQLGGIVRLHGALPEERVRDFLARAEVFVLASVRTTAGDQDGIPVALMEAMAMQAAVVSTRVSGIPELVTDSDSGLLVEPGDVEALAGAVERLLAAPLLRDRLAVRAREVVRARHDIQTSAARLTAIFLDATRSAPSRLRHR